MLVHMKVLWNFYVLSMMYSLGTDLTVLTAVKCFYGVM